MLRDISKVKVMLVDWDLLGNMADSLGFLVIDLAFLKCDD